MARARFTAELINDLKAKVADHARWAEQAPGRPMTKLADLKAIYERHHRGQRPALNAMQKVDDRLADLRKAGDDTFDESKHPRDADGQFTEKGGGSAARSAPPPKVRVEVPKTITEHRQTQDESAGYAALTADVMPTKFYETTGTAAREIATTAAGVATAVSLSRKRLPGEKAGIARRIAGGVGQATGHTVGAAVAALPVSAARHGTIVARNFINRYKKNPAAALPAGSFKDRARAAVRNSAKVGGKIGRSVAERSADTLGWAIRHASQAAADAAKSPARREIQRAVVIGTAGVMIGRKLNDSLKGTWADPQVWGAEIDPFSSRVVRKSADGALDQLDQIRTSVLAAMRKDGDAVDLRKALRPLGLIGQGLSAVGGALGGAAIGGGAAYGVNRAVGAIGSGKKGNPYRDEDGKFTSRDRAVRTIGMGSALGAIAGGAAALLAARRGNAGALVRAVTAGVRKPGTPGVTELFDRKVRAVSAPRGVGAVRELIEQKSTFIENKLQSRSHPAIKAWQSAKDVHAKYGSSSPLAIKEAVRADVNEALVSRLASMDDFIVDVAAKKSLRDVRAGIASAPRKAEAAINATRAAVERMTPDQFSKATEALPKKLQEEVRRLHGARSTLINQVDDVIGKHLKDIDTATDAAAQAAKTTKAAQEALDASRMRSGGMGADTAAVEAAQNDMKAAQRALVAATKAQEKADKALLDLRNAGPALKSVATGKPLTTMTDLEAQALVGRAEERARAAAAGMHQAAVSKAREAQISRLADRKARMLAVAAATGKRYGAPARARVEQTALIGADRDVRQAKRAVSQAILKREPIETMKARSADLKAAEQKRIAAGQAYEEALGGTKPPKRILPESVSNALQDTKRDVKIIRGVVADKVNAFTAKPTVGRMMRATEAMAARGKAEANRSLRAAFMENGKVSFDRVARAWPLLVGGVGGSGILGGAASYADWIYGSITKRGEDRVKLRQPGEFKLERYTDPATGGGFVGLSIPDPENKNERVFVWGRKRDRDGSSPQPIFAGGRVSDFRNRQNQQNNQQRTQGSGGGGGDSGEARNLPQPLAEAVGKAFKSAQEKGLIERAGPDFDGAPRVSFRKSADPDSERNQAAGQFMNHVRKAAGDGEPDKGRFWGALGDLFSKQGSVLKASQFNNLLTGFNGAGEFRQGLFRKSEGFKAADADTVSEALGGEVGRVMRDNPPDTDQQRANLHRAVYMIGRSKNLSPESMAIIHEQIRNPTVSPKVSAASVAAPNDMPEGWKATEMANVSKPAATRVARTLEMHQAGQVDDLQTTIEIMARFAHANHDLSMQDSIKVVADALADPGTGIPKNVRQDAVRDQDFEVFIDAMDRYANALKESRRVRKAFGLRGDLRKFSIVYDESRHTRHPSGSDRGGEFAPKSGGGGSVAGRAGRGAASSVTEQSAGAAAGGAAGGAAGSRAPRRARPGERPFTDPHRVGTEVGAALVGTAAWQMASKYMASAAKQGGVLTAERAAPGLADAGGGIIADRASKQGIKRLVATAGKESGLGLRLASKFLPGVAGGAAKALVPIAASLVGGAAGSEIGHRVVEAGYGAAGKKSPGRYTPPPPIDFGETAAEFVGSAIGTIAGGAGGAFAGGVGAFAGAAAGGYGGGEAGKQLYRYFTGYDPKAAQRMSRHFKGLSA